MLMDLYKPSLRFNIIISAFLIVFISQITSGQQQPDTLFEIKIGKPRYTSTYSPSIYIDESHNNLHKRKGNFAPFTKLAEKDGYAVKSFKSYSDLKSADVLVIANAINEKNMGNWQRPVYPGFEESEIGILKEWVSNGGSLLLIADHMPFAGATNKLAQAFGFDFCDGFAQLAEKEKNQDVFSFENKRLLKTVLTDGSLVAKVDAITSFTGSSFSIPKTATGIMQFQKNDLCLKPEIAWQFNENTERIPINGYYQGAIMEFGKGRLAVFGEAAMFTAQTIEQNGNTFHIGFNSYFAPNNVAFIRNVLAWLTGNAKSTFPNAPSSILTAEILEVNRHMEETFNEKRFKDIANFYTEDSKMIGPNTDIKGKDMKEYWGMFNGEMTWALENIEIKNLNDDFAMQTGISKITYIKPNGTSGILASRFTLIWKKTGNGWRILHDIFFPIDTEP